MKNFCINHLHFGVGNKYNKFSTLITNEAINKYSLAKYGKVPDNFLEKDGVRAKMCIKTIKYALNNNWRKQHGLVMLKKRCKKCTNQSN